MNVTPKYRLEANARYEERVKRTTIIFRPQDRDLYDAVRPLVKDKQLSTLVRKLLREHLNLEPKD